MARLELKGLCKGWDAPVIDRLDLTIEEGTFFVILGPSGVGKTTLLRLVAGLERPDAGSVHVGEADITALPPYRRPVAMTFESYALYPHLSVFENIASPLRARRMKTDEIRRRVADVAELLRIGHLLDRKPGEVSGGQKQRTALGRTLVSDPEVFLLDEPLSHLDARIRHELRLQFHNLEALRRVATLYVTHDYAEALALGDRIGVLGDGELRQVGTAREMFERPNSRFVAEHLGQPTINVLPITLAANGDALRAQANGFDFAVAPAHRQALEAHGAPVEAGIRPQHLSVGEGDGGFGAEVELFEALGAMGVLLARVGDSRITVKTSPDAKFTPGERVRLSLAPESVHYFDARSGASLFHGAR